MIPQSLIRSVSASLYERSLKKIPDDTHAALERARGSEGDATGRRTLTIMLKSADAAVADRLGRLAAFAAPAIGGIIATASHSVLVAPTCPRQSASHSAEDR